MRLRILILAVVGAFVGVSMQSHAGEAPAPVPPGAYSVIRPGDNPLAKPGGAVPVPEIVWEKVEVRPEHPRLLFTKDTRQALARRLESHPIRPEFNRAVEERDPLACALLYQLTGRKAFARTAIIELLAGRAGEGAPYSLRQPLVFDWTYDAMTDDERRDAIARLWANMSLDRASGWPRCSPYSGYPDDPRPSETPPNQWPRFYNWTFHDQDWARRYSPTLASVLALAGHQPRAAEGVRNYWEYSLKDAVLFMDYLRDGSYWQGYYWSVTHRIYEIVRVLEMMKSACGIDYLDPKKHPYLANFGMWLLYCSDPWRQRTIYNYGDGQMVHFDYRTYNSLLASNSLAADPHVEWLVRRATPPVLNWEMELFYHDHTLTARGPSDLPLARCFPGTGLAVSRSAWTGHGVWAATRWCDWFDMHCHPDAGSFTLYCKSPLAPDAGYYSLGFFHAEGYSTRTVAHNTITVRDPAARAPLNDGCQRKRDKRVWSFATGRDAWVYNQDEFDRADLTAFENHKLYDYSAGAAGKAYRSEDVREFMRQTVFLRDGVFIVFDRVETTRPNLEKRWLMQLVGEPAIDGKLLKAEVKGHIEDYDGSLTVSKGSEGAWLRCHTLLPADRRIRKVGGPIPEVPISTLARTPRRTHRMATGSRWEWTDPLILDYNDTLTGKKLGAICIERDTPTDAEYEVTDTEFYIKLNAYERGRVDEFRLRLADYKTILDLTRELGKRLKWQWHTAIHYLPGYEYYNEGINYAPAYRDWVWADPIKYAPELVGRANDQGAWRIEVTPAKPAARDYFLHVIRMQADQGDEPGAVALVSDGNDKAEAKVVLEGLTYALTFAKTGEVGGHIRITDTSGKVLADRDFARKVIQAQ